MRSPKKAKPGEHRYTMVASFLPGIQGVCFLFFMGIVRRTFDLHFFVDVIGFAGLVAGFLVGSWRFWFTEPTDEPPRE